MVQLLVIILLQLLEALDEVSDADIIEKVDIVADYVAEKLNIPLSDVENQLWKYLHRFIITGTYVIITVIRVALSFSTQHY